MWISVNFMNFSRNNVFDFDDQPVNAALKTDMWTFTMNGTMTDLILT